MRRSIHTFVEGMKVKARQGLCAIALLALFSVFSVSSAQAQLQVGGILRDEYAQGLTPNTTSAGMGGVFVALDRADSMNPASIASVENADVSLAYGMYDHDWGPDAARLRFSGTARLPWFDGAARILFDGLDSDGAGRTLLPGEADLEFDGQTLGLHLGANLSDWLALGVGAYPYEPADVDMITPGGTVRGEAMSQVGSIEVGAIARAGERVRLGAIFVHIIDELKAELPDRTSLEDDWKINYLALGLSMMPFEGTVLAADWWYVDIDGSFNPDTPYEDDYERWNFGLEQRLGEGLTVRFGSQNEGFTTGLTIEPVENFDISYAYIDKALRDKEAIFGETSCHTVSVGFKF